MEVEDENIVAKGCNKSVPYITFRGKDLSGAEFNIRGKQVNFNRNPKLRITLQRLVKII